MFGYSLLDGASCCLDGASTLFWATFFQAFIEQVFSLLWHLHWMLACFLVPRFGFTAFYVLLQIFATDRGSKDSSGGHDYPPD